jgi:hypothetical protein
MSKAIPSPEDSRAALLLRLNVRVETPDSWGLRLSRWLEACRSFDSRLAHWIAIVTHERVPHDPAALAELLQRLGGRSYGGAKIDYALALDARSSGEGGDDSAVLGFFVAFSEVDTASLDLPARFVLDHEDPRELARFVALSSEILGARWAALKFDEQARAMKRSEILHDYPGWITYFEGVNPDALRRLRPPAMSIEIDNGVVVVSVPSLEGETGESLAAAARRVQRDLLGSRLRRLLPL